MAIKWNLAKSIRALRQPRGIYDLLVLTHSGFTQDWYLVNNQEDLTYNGNTYIASAFAFQAARRKEQSGAAIAISNLDTRIHKQLNLAVKNAPNENIMCKHIRVSIEKSGGLLEATEMSNLETFEINDILITKETVTVGLTIRNSLPLNSGKHLFSPSKFPNNYL